MIKHYLLAIAILLAASSAQAAVTSFTWQPVAKDLLPGYATYDLLVTGTGQFTGVHMDAELIAGAFYQDAIGGNTPPNRAFFPLAPTIEYDTFVGMGGPTQDTTFPIIITGPQGPGPVGGGGGIPPVITLNQNRVYMTWAPAGTHPVHDPTDFFLGRFTIAAGSQGTVDLLGFSFQQPNYTHPTININISPLYGSFRSTLRVGEELDFGFGPETRTLELATRNVGQPGGPDIEVAEVVFTGRDAALFSAPGFTPYELMAGGGDTSLAVQFNGTGAPGRYNAQLELRDAAGATLANYTLAAQVPEPATIAIVGLAFFGVCRLRLRSECRLSL